MQKESMNTGMAMKSVAEKIIGLNKNGK